MVSRENFDFVTSPVPTPAAGEALVEAHYVSLDPAMRGWLNEGKSYVPPVGVGEVMRAIGVGGVASNDPALAVGLRVGLTGIRRRRGRQDVTKSIRTWCLAALARRRRHAGHDRLLRPPRRRRQSGRTLVVRRRRRRRCRGSALGRSSACASLASPAAATSAAIVDSSVSTPSSTTRTTTCAVREHAPKASTSTSTTSAARSRSRARAAAAQGARGPCGATRSTTTPGSSARKITCPAGQPGAHGGFVSSTTRALSRSGAGSPRHRGQAQGQGEPSSTGSIVPEALCAVPRRRKPRQADPQDLTTRSLRTLASPALGAVERERHAPSRSRANASISATALSTPSRLGPRS